jgi:beta-mannosidase
MWKLLSLIRCFVLAFVGLFGFTLILSVSTDASAALNTDKLKAAENYQQTLHTAWQFRLAPEDVAGHPEFASWRAAQVPGHVHTDLLAQHLIPDPYVGMNEAGLQWIGKSRWEYQLVFDADEKILARQHQSLVFDGLDTFAEVFLNGEKILHSENAFRRYRIDIDAKLKAKGNLLLVIFHSPIDQLLPQVLAMPHKLAGNYPSPYGDEPRDALTANFVRKPGYHYGWDWGPRYVTAGIWRDVKLEAYDQLRLSNWAVLQTVVNRDLVQGEVQLSLQNLASSAQLSVPLKEANLLVEVFDPEGRRIYLHVGNFFLNAGEIPLGVNFQIAKPRLWFPNGYGEQALYRVELSIYAGKKQLLHESKRLGFRSVELRREQDQWGQSFAFVINGIPVFAKGANVIPFDMFPNRVMPQMQRNILQSAKDANMNMLRLWGGGYYESDAFYDMADEMGLMIWQDFMFGGGVVPAYDQNFRENVLIEAREQVQRLRHHPSIVLWCGNNEEETAWKDWGIGKDLRSANPEFAEKVWQGYQQLFDKDLRKVVLEQGGGVPYWSSSPSNDLSEKANDSNNGDKHFWEVWAGSKPVEDYLLETPRFMSEYGLQAWPDLKTINAFSKKEEQEIDSPVIRQHQKFLAGAGNDRLLQYIRAHYRELKDFEDFVYLSQVMQAEGISLAIKHHRSNMPRTMGSLYWQLNDVWPGASWSSIDYFGRWKALHYVAKRAFAPLSVATENVAGVTTLNLVSDKLQEQSGKFRMRIMDFYGKTIYDQTEKFEISANTAVQSDQFRNGDLLTGNDPLKHFAVFELIQNGQIISQDEVYFALPKDLILPQATIKAAWKKRRVYYELTLTSNALARAVWLDFGELEIALSNNAMTLLPNQSVIVKVKSQSKLEQLQAALRVRHLASR